MDTLNHQNPTQSDHNGVHVCHKCEWPFPNPHPSSRLRRAHKKVCGTIEGYKVDTSQDKTPVDDLDNDHKISIGDKVVERTISRKSSSGFGSRSSRSNRSEDEVFADAVTEFGEASDGGMSRGNSMQFTGQSGPEDSQLDLESAIDDDSSATSTVLEVAQLLTAKTFEGKNAEVKAEIPSQDQSSINNPAPIYANAVGHHLVQSSGTPEELDTNAEKCKENAKKDNLLELKTTNIETTEALEHISPGTYNPSSNSIGEVDTPVGNPSKYHVVAEENQPKIEANEKADLLYILNVDPLQVDREIADEDLDKISMVLEAPSAVVEQEIVGGLEQISDHNAPYGELQSEGALEDIRDGVWEEQEVGLSSEKAFPEDSTTVSIRDQGSGTNVCGDAVDDVKGDGESLDIHGNNNSKFPEGELYVTGSTPAECSVDDVARQDEKLLKNVIDSSEVQVGELAAKSSTLAEYHVYDITPQEETLMNTIDSDNVDNAAKEILFPEVETADGVHDQGTSACGGTKKIDDVNDDVDYAVTRETDSNEVNDISARPEDDNEPVSAEDSDESIKSGSSHQGTLAEAQNSSEIVGSKDCKDRVDARDIVNTNDCFDYSLKMSEFEGSFCPSSTVSPAMDIIHARELTDIQESSSRSCSAAYPVTKNDSRISSQVSAEAAAVKPNAMEEVQDCEPLVVSKSEFTCEIETSDNQRQTALKTLLGEAIAKSRSESPNYDEFPAINTKAKDMVGKEWDSPARYPVKIKTEKKRSKSRWVPFLCCSSSVSANGP